MIFTYQYALKLILCSNTHMVARTTSKLASSGVCMHICIMHDPPAEQRRTEREHVHACMQLMRIWCVIYVCSRWAQQGDRARPTNPDLVLVVFLPKSKACLPPIPAGTTTGSDYRSEGACKYWKSACKYGQLASKHRDDGSRDERLSSPGVWCIVYSMVGNIEYCVLWLFWVNI